MLLNCKQCRENGNVCLLSLLNFEDDVNDFDVGVNDMKYIFLFCMPKDAHECPKVLLNAD